MTKKSWKEPVSTFTATVLVALALIVGFISGIIFSDRAYRKLGIQGMPPGGGMPPGIMQGELPEGHPPIEGGGEQMVSPNIQQSITQMESMLDKEPENVALLVHLGNLYFDSNQHQKSIEKYEKALKLSPSMPDVWTDCGVMYREMGNLAKAVEYFKKASEINPNHAQSYFNLGVVYQSDLADYPKAIDAWSKFLQLNPTFERANVIRKQIAEIQANIKSGGKKPAPASNTMATKEEESSHADAELARGKTLYREKGCTSCHAIGGIGGKIGPDLTHVGSKRDVRYLEQIIIAPKSVVPNSTMPAYKGSKKDVDAMVKYLQSLK